ncbi:hypothetical protein ERJ75_000974600 [Trypanosoma vivax]|nr:hypothetical protein ERJ75_000974600 [Trypanosoma vivax]
MLNKSLTFNEPGDYGKQIISFSCVNPPEQGIGIQRVGHTMVVYKATVYLYGGCGPRGSYSSSIYCNTRAMSQWKELRGVGVVPGGRANHTSIVFENKMIVYGGQRFLEVFDDLFLVNLDTLRWEKINLDNSQGPGPVFSHAAVLVPPTQAMIIIGGFHKRRHNMFVAHSFDIRNRVWCGIRAPESVNPLHVQLVSAAYHHNSTSLVVIGLTKKNALSTASTEVPTIFMLNVYTNVWKEVATTVSIGSPIPFHVPNLWEQFVPEQTTLGGVYDEACGEWYFPFMLRADNVLADRQADMRMSMSINDFKVSGTKSVPMTPLQGFTRDSKPERDKCVLLTLDLNAMTWSLIPLTFPKHIVSELMARRLFKQDDRGSRKNLPPMSIRPSYDRGEASSRVLFFSSRGVSRFQRKYAYVIITSQKARRSRMPGKTLIMHGGCGPEDYVMYMFSPTFRNRGTGSMTLALSQTTLPDALRSFVSVASTNEGTSDGPELQENFPSEVMSENSSMCVHFIQAPLDAHRGSSSASGAEEKDANIFIGRRHRIESDPTILPSYTMGRNQRNANRFAILYHPSNAIRDTRLLPDPNCPVAFLNTEKDVDTWAEDYYMETRQWIYSSLALEKEDERKDRKGQRRRRKTRKSLVHADGEEGSLSDEESVTSRDMSDTKNAEPTALQSKSRKRSSSNFSTAPAWSRDFFRDKMLELFDLTEYEYVESRGKDQRRRSDQFMREDNYLRMNMRVRRNQENHRLPLDVFHHSSIGNISDPASTAAHTLMVNALARYEDDSPLSRHQRTLIRWRYLRVMVLNGEASSVLHLVNLGENKGYGIDVSSTSMLMLAPELYTKGANSVRVPTKPTAYTVPQFNSRSGLSAEVTPGGHVLYRFSNSANCNMRLRT